MKRFFNTVWASATPLVQNNVLPTNHDTSVLLNADSDTQFISIPIPVREQLTITFWALNNSPNWNDGSWFYYMDVRDMVAGSYVTSNAIGPGVRMYVDGVENNATTLRPVVQLGQWQRFVFVTTSPGVYAGPMTLNARYTSGECVLNIEYADVRVYDRALTEEEIVTGDYLVDGLLQRYDFTGLEQLTPTITSVPDVTGNGVIAQLVNYTLPVETSAPSEAYTYARWSAAESTLPNGGLVGPGNWVSVDGNTTLLASGSPYTYSATGLSETPTLIAPYGYQANSGSLYLPSMTLPNETAATIMVLQSTAGHVQVAMEYSPDVNAFSNSFAYYIEGYAFESYLDVASLKTLRSSPQLYKPVIFASRYKTRPRGLEFQVDKGPSGVVLDNTTSSNIGFDTNPLFVGARNNNQLFLQGAISALHVFHTAPPDDVWEAWQDYYRKLYRLDYQTVPYMSPLFRTFAQDQYPFQDVGGYRQSPNIGFWWELEFTKGIRWYCPDQNASVWEIRVDGELVKTVYPTKGELVFDYHPDTDTVKTVQVKIVDQPGGRIYLYIPDVMVWS